MLKSDIKILKECKNIMNTLPQLSRDGLKFLYKIVDQMSYEERKDGLPRKLLDYRSSGKDDRFYQMDLSKISFDLIGRETGPIKSLLDKDYKCSAATDDGDLCSFERKNFAFKIEGKELNCNDYCSKKFLYDFRDWIKNDMIPRFLFNDKEKKFNIVNISYMSDRPISAFLDIRKTIKNSDLPMKPKIDVGIFLNITKIDGSFNADRGKVIDMDIDYLHEDDNKMAMGIKSIDDIDKIFLVIEKIRKTYLDFIKGKKLVFMGDNKNEREQSMFDLYKALNSIEIKFDYITTDTSQFFTFPNFIFPKNIESKGNISDKSNISIRKFFDEKTWSVDKDGSNLFFYRYKQIFPDFRDKEIVKATKDLDKKIKKIIEKYDELDKYEDKKYSLYQIKNTAKKDSRLYQLIISKIEPPINFLPIETDWGYEIKLIGDNKGARNKKTEVKLLIKDIEITVPTDNLMYLKADVNPEENLKKFKSTMEIIDRDEWVNLFKRKTKDSGDEPDEWFFHIYKYEILEKLTPEFLKKMGIPFINKLSKDINLILIRRAKIDLYELGGGYNYSTYKNFIWKL